MHRLSRFVTLLFALLLTSNSFAENRNLEQELGDIESQINSQPSKFFYRLNQLKEDLPQFDIYSQQYFWTLYCDTAVRMELYQDVIDLVNNQLSQATTELTNDNKIELLICRAESKQALGKTQQSLLDYNMALEQAINSKHQELEISVLVKLGQMHGSLSNFAKGQKYLLRAFKLAQSLENDELLNNVNSSLGGFYAYKKEYAKSIPYYHKTKDYHLAKGHLQQASISVYNLGVIANKLQDYKRAVAYFNEAKSLSEKVGDIPGIAYAELKMVPALLAEQRFKEAEEGLNVAYNFFFQQKNSTKLAEVQKFRAQIDIHEGQYQLAIDLLHKVLPIYQKSQFLDEQSAVLLMISEAYLLNDDPDNSLRFYKQYHQIENELASRQSEEITQRMAAEFQFELKENENSQLKKLLDAEQQKVKAQKATQNLQIGLIVAGILLIVFVVYHLYKQYSYGKKMRALAMRDDLTQIANRRAIMASLKKSVSWSLRYQDSLSIAIFDIDNFKNFNDSYGHDVGDQVLAAFAQEMANAIRSTDDIGRLGGEEFMLIMPNTTVEQAKILMSRIMPAIRALTIKVKGKDYHVTASAGVTEFDIKNETLMDLYGRADTALYLAKESGRDQYKVS
ncbi:GGDEF domain-containing protein [Thalassotalea sp. M1531]|uniref:diguanylate cyclase n=1 Tax=Thalassotalea algicola TaxID=2716224 RepID=A0A7Y0Q4R7_9GAMM|nr:GGDEF domain-containing protein [Thalassotalea algicola]NMP30259.1 GGDEF domain-containing protein [Thalassotalea algicola]